MIHQICHPVVSSVNNKLLWPKSNRTKPCLDRAEDEDGGEDDGHVEVVVAGAEVVVHHQLQVLRHEDKVHAAEAELRQAQENVDQDPAKFEMNLLLLLE